MFSDKSFLNRFTNVNRHEIYVTYVMLRMKVSVRFIILIFIGLPTLVVSSSIHGGTLLAMNGKDCVVLVSDSRFSSQATGNMFLGEFPRLVYRVGSKCLLGCFGLDADARTLATKLREKLHNHNEQDLGPEHIARVVSNSLYENDLILSPIVAGLKENSVPYICTMDGLGAQTVSDKFAVVGTANEGLLAVCESLYVPDLSPDQLLQLATRCFNLAMQRDVLSGASLRAFTLTKDAIYRKEIKQFDN
jgi:20S proteasome subunit beta 3